MNEVYIRSNQFANVRYILNDKVAMMREEFQIKGWDVATCITCACCCALHGNLLVAKGDIGGFDKLKHYLASRKYAFGCMGEDRVPFEF